MNRAEQKIANITSDAISDVLNTYEPSRLASIEHRFARMVATALVEWNRGKITKPRLNAIVTSANDVLEAIRRRRKELADGKTSIS